ncbi:nucleotidyltransferase family protein [Christiangramia sp. SM2212]|uniref:Nucleotidyltransferase family protein n=1 Tax=Christiangramia sediminicola TaxID=3073267 RepID=A0ABU1EQ45_9FLAO|nr:nucleotidyltransferase family protein [Christiangramia sp. SM2212]MDR5590509.1 nucleotidyltransferase family protein [Christiangramia sp. SM2212]
MIGNKKIGIVILAAGASSRLGFPKQLVKFKGKVLLQNIIDLADSFDFKTKILVLGANEKEIREQIDIKEFDTVSNENWQEGMGSSIRSGLERALKLQPELEHLMILLSDQPLVTREQIQQLVNVQIKNNVQAAFSEYEGETGVPAIFSKELFPQLLKLDGDQGAKKLIFISDLKYETVRFEGGKFDVDTQADVELLKDLEK